jgi:hypothetical protein
MGYAHRVRVAGRGMRLHSERRHGGNCHGQHQMIGTFDCQKKSAFRDDRN